MFTPTRSHIPSLATHLRGGCARICTAPGRSMKSIPPAAILRARAAAAGVRAVAGAAAEASEGTAEGNATAGAEGTLGTVVVTLSSAFVAAVRVEDIRVVKNV